MDRCRSGSSLFRSLLYKVQRNRASKLELDQGLDFFPAELALVDGQVGDLFVAVAFPGHMGNGLLLGLVRDGSDGLVELVDGRVDAVVDIADGNVLISQQCAAQGGGVQQVEVVCTVSGQWVFTGTSVEHIVLPGSDDDTIAATNMRGFVDPGVSI